MTAAVLTAFAAASCEHAKFLDQYPYSQTSPENFYTSERSMYMALTSCYEVINGHKIPGASYVVLSERKLRLGIVIHNELSFRRYGGGDIFFRRGA